jgi:ribulose 1,5-bisphosphate synthetase/thiazole synthase
MKPEVNAVLQEVKANLINPKPAMPDFKAMSIMEATKWCLANGMTLPRVIAQTTGKQANTIYTAMWKIRNPKRVKVLQRRAKKVKALKSGLEGVKGEKLVKVAKPKITNGLYDDGMETPWRDAIMRQGGSFVMPRSLEIADKATLEAENRRLKILVEHYESLLFKGGK